MTQTLVLVLMLLVCAPGYSEEPTYFITADDVLTFTDLKPANFNIGNEVIVSLTPSYDLEIRCSDKKISYKINFSDIDSLSKKESNAILKSILLAFRYGYNKEGKVNNKDLCEDLPTTMGRFKK